MNPRNLIPVHTKKSTTEVVADLRDAAQRLRTRGFAKFVRHAQSYDTDNKPRTYAEKVGSVCLLGAFEACSGWPCAENSAPQALNVLARFLVDHENCRSEYASSVLAEWNNADERTKADVLQVLDTVAGKVETGILAV